MHSFQCTSRINIFAVAATQGESPTDQTSGSDTARAVRSQVHQLCQVESWLRLVENLAPAEVEVPQQEVGMSECAGFQGAAKTSASGDSSVTLREGDNEPSTKALLGAVIFA